MPKPNGTGKQRDPTCSHPAVQLVRDTFKLCPSLYWRNAIIVTADQDLALWEDVIREWKKPFYDVQRKRFKKNGRNPTDFKHMLSEFDRRHLEQRSHGKGQVGRPAHGPEGGISGLPRGWLS